MLPYTNRARSTDTKNNFELARSCTYDLQSVVVHVGNLETGKSFPCLLDVEKFTDYICAKAIMYRTRVSETSGSSLMITMLHWHQRVRC
jgi:hypothetical protein